MDGNRKAWTWRMVCWIVALALTGQARADAEQEAAKVPAVVLVWGSGSQAEAEAAQRRLEAERPKWKDALIDAEGYPRLVPTDAVEGLRPGLHAVLLGACRPGELAPVLEAYRAVAPQVYPREVRLPERELGCPSFAPTIWGPMELERTKQKRVGKAKLTLALFGGGEDSSAAVYAIVVTAADAKGEIVDRVSAVFGSREGYHWCNEPPELHETPRGWGFSVGALDPVYHQAQDTAEAVFELDRSGKLRYDVEWRRDPRFIGPDTVPE